MVVLVPERVGQTLDRSSRGDHVAPGVQRAVDLGQGECLACPYEHSEGRVAQVAAAQRVDGGRGSAHRRGAADSGPAEASEAAAVSGGPEAVAERGELATKPGHLGGDPLVRAVESGRSLDELPSANEELVPAVGREGAGS